MCEISVLRSIIEAGRLFFLENKLPLLSVRSWEPLMLQLLVTLIRLTAAGPTLSDRPLCYAYAKWASEGRRHPPLAEKRGEGRNQRKELAAATVAA
jgi:hypothetical protein